jgi:hypothetical protein
LVDDSQLCVKSSSFFSPCSAGQLYHAPPKTNTGHLLSRQKHQITSNKSIKKISKRTLTPNPWSRKNIQNHRPMAQYGPAQAAYGLGAWGPGGNGGGPRRLLIALHMLREAELLTPAMFASLAVQWLPLVTQRVARKVMRCGDLGNGFTWMIQQKSGLNIV